MNPLVRHYRSEESPEIGDIIELFEGAFGAAVITRIDPEFNQITLDRVHASAERFGYQGQLQIGVERVVVSRERLRESLKVFVTGASQAKDNRYKPIV